MSRAFVESSIRAFTESPLRARNPGAREYGRRHWQAVSIRYGISGYDTGFPGPDYSSGESGWDPYLSDDPLWFFLLADPDPSNTVQANVFDRVSGCPAFNTLTVDMTVTPSPFTMTGTWNPNVVRTISNYTGEEISYTEDFDGADNAGGGDWFNGWSSESFSNTGEGGSATITKSGSGTYDIYQSNLVPEIYQFKPSGYYETNGNDISGFSYVDEITFSYEMTCVYSNDYTHATFLTDAVELWDELKANYDFETWPVDVLRSIQWNDDKTGLIDGFLGGSTVWMSIPNWDSTHHLDAGVQYEKNNTTDPVDSIVSICAVTVRVRGPERVVEYRGEYTHDDDPPQDEVTVNSTTSTIRPESFFVIEPSPTEISDLTDSNIGCAYMIGWADEYTESTPDFPVPS